MAKLAWLALSAFAFALTGCGKGTVYPKPADEVRTTLSATQLPPLVFGTVPPDLEMDTSDPSKVVWIVNQDGHEVMRFIAGVTAEDASSTRVTLDVAAPTSGAYGNVQQRLDENRSIKRMYLDAMNERIASSIEGRPFDLSKVMGSYTAAAAANLGRISADMEAAAAADDRDPSGDDAR